MAKLLRGRPAWPLRGAKALALATRRVEDLHRTEDDVRTYLVRAPCPDESRDVVLGGACGYVGTQNFLVGTSITNSSTEAKFSCGYTIPETITATSSVTVICLSNAK